MALEKIGLGGILTFNEKQAVRGMQNATKSANIFSRAFMGVQKTVKSMGAAMAQGAQAARGMGVAMLPATAALGIGVKTAADFEQQMDGVQAVTRASGREMKLLEAKAKSMGAQTSFSATQAGQGMELLGRAGFKTADQLSAIRPVMDAAAAEGIDLASSASIISNTLKGLGLEADQAANAADVLALASSKTNTDMLGLGEAMKFAAPQAKTLGVGLVPLTAMLGAVADAGLKGTIGGTSLTQAMLKLSKPTKKGAEEMRKLGVGVTMMTDGSVNAIATFKDINAALATTPDRLERARIQAEIFGVRGQKAFSAIGTAIDKGKLDELVSDLGRASEGMGAAAEMAEIRLGNLHGQMTLLKSAAEGFAIETAGKFLEPMTEGVTSMREGLSKTVLVLQELNSEEGLTKETADKAGVSIVAMATGMKKGIDDVTEAWTNMRNGFREFFGGLVDEQAPASIQSFTRMATILFLVAAAVAPILIAVGALAFFVTGVLIPAITAIGTVASIVMAPWILGIAAVVLAFVLAWDFINEAFVQPFMEGFEWASGGITMFTDAIGMMAANVANDFSDMINGFKQAATALMPVFKFIFKVVGALWAGVTTLVMGIVTVIAAVVTGVLKGVMFGIMKVTEAIVNLVKWTAEKAGGLASIFGLDFGKDLTEFGKGSFEINLGQGNGSDFHFDKLPGAAQESQAAKDDALSSAIAFKQEEVNLKSRSPEVTLKTDICIDGKKVARATGKHKGEISDRAGFKSTPWQRRTMAENGAVPTAGGI